MEECDACKAGLMAPILHFHNHYNLLDTMRKYSKVVALELDIQKLFNSFIVKFGFLMSLKKNTSKQDNIL